MTLLGLSCEDYPPILMGLGCALAMFVIVKWAREEDIALPKWKWGDAPRRPRHDDGMLGHAIGAILAAFAISFAFNHPICG